MNVNVTLARTLLGLWVTRGGISINNQILGTGMKGGMLMTGGISVHSGGLVVKNPGGRWPPWLRSHNIYPFTMIKKNSNDNAFHLQR